MTADPKPTTDPHLEPVRVLFVCHANLCRSSMAERLARLLMAGRPRAEAVHTHSAGTHAPDAAGIHPHAATVLREFGADAGGFRSRPVSASLLNRAGLVLTATRPQRGHCVTMAPPVLRRTFTLRQFARLAAAVPTDRLPPGDPRARLKTLLDEIALIRPAVPPLAAGEEDVADPVLGSVDTFRQCAIEISELVCVLVDTLVPN